MSAPVAVAPGTAAAAGAAYRVVVMAFACEPHRGSEPGVGFAFAAAAARLAREDGRRVVLVTRPHTVEKIRRALGDDAAFLEILPVGLPRAVVAATGRRRSRYAYLLWQLLAVRRVHALLGASGTPTVVHHVTFATEALPTFEGVLRRRAAIVVGPAGSAAVPGGGARLAVRRALRVVTARSTLRPADVLVAQNHHVAAGWAGRRRPVVVEPNIVAEALTGPRPAVRWDAAVAGLLIERKRVDLAVRAFAASAATGRLVVIGDGPERGALEALAAETGVADRVDFVGGRPRDEVLALLARSRVLLHPSRQEGAGWVVGEAQSVGAWPIVFAGAGADGPVRAAGAGTIVAEVSADALATALDAALAAPRAEPSTRWTADRLPGRLRDWYAAALARRGVAAR